MKVYLAHSKKIDYINELYKPIKDAFFLKEYNFIFPHEKSSKSLNGFDFYKDIDIMIAEVSESGTGIGIELGFAYSLNIPILCFYKKGCKYANSINSVTKNIVEYESIDDLLFKIYILIDKKCYISQIYQQLGIPKHLQKHMLDTASICYLISLKTVKDFDTLVEEMLLHDVGNLLKLQPHEITCDLTRWIRDYLYNKFNGDDHLATNYICKLYGFTDDRIERMNQKTLANNVNIAKIDDIKVKIEAYCDQRVAPEGVVSLQERLEELKKRHSKIKGATLYGENAEKIIKAAFEIEEQVMKEANMSKESITKEKIENISKALINFKIK